MSRVLIVFFLFLACACNRPANSIELGEMKLLVPSEFVRDTLASSDCEGCRVCGVRFLNENIKSSMVLIQFIQLYQKLYFMIKLHPNIQLL